MGENNEKSLLILLIEILSISLYAQTKSDSLAIVSAQWEVQELVKGITHKKILIQIYMVELSI